MFLLIQKPESNRIYKASSQQNNHRINYKYFQMKSKVFHRMKIRILYNKWIKYRMLAMDLALEKLKSQLNQRHKKKYA